jgi:hypothetical protein
METSGGMPDSRSHLRMYMGEGARPDRWPIGDPAFDPSTGRRGGELLRFDRYANPNEDMGPLAFALSPDGQSLSMSPTSSGPLRILSLRGAPARELLVKGLNVKAQAIGLPMGRD